MLSIYKLFCDFSDVNYPENHDETSCFADNIIKFKSLLLLSFMGGLRIDH